ncbi:MAG: pyridoxal-phosphate dependent enzyme [Bacteroidetes bacterium]|nr:pyridoxal-phosphate dependent enzyme [Bacteroidota bacterium]
MALKNNYIDFVFTKNNVNLYIYRLDKLQPYIQGNKYFKLKYNLIKAKEKHLPIVTIGGAFSNHIHATALACQQNNIPCYGIIRGSNFKVQSPTLSFVEKMGMKLIFIPREDYKTLRNINTQKSFNEIAHNFAELPKNYFFVPEGGTNELGLKGASEILNNIEPSFDYFFCPVGSGGTISGIINSLKGNKKVIGIACAKDKSLTEKIKLLTNNLQNWEINYNYTFKGFGKWNVELINFINQFYKDYNIALEPIYTGKMMYALNKMINNNSFQKPCNILAIHTGGLQGLEGFNLMNNGIIKIPPYSFDDSSI